MFQLHDTTRRRIAGAIFLLFGVLPAMIVVGWCIEKHLPGRVEKEAAWIGRQLGLDVKIAGLRYLRPGVVLYEQFTAADPETGQPIFRCQWLEVSRGYRANSQGQRRSTLSIIASQPEIQGDAVSQVWRCLQRTLEGFHGPLESDAQIMASDLTLQADRNPQTLTDVRATLESLPEGVHAQVAFRLVGADTPEPAQIRVARDRQTSPPTTRFELYTGDGELPCNVLALGLDTLYPLGPRCRFRGYIWASELPDGWKGEITGHLADVDFGRLISDYFPHRLSGLAEVTIRSACFQHGRLEEGNAEVVAGPGAVDRSLVDAAVDRLGLIPGKLRLPDRDSIDYDQLVFLATLDAQGLRLSGRCDVSEPGTILSQDRQSLLLVQANHKPLSPVALVRTLVPQSEVQVPATRQTDWLLRHLPVPEVMPISGSPTLPTARAHLRNDPIRR